MHANRLHPLAAGALVLALACLAVGLGSGAAGAQCSYTALTSGTPVTVGTSPGFFTFNQSINYWTAIAVQPPGTADWDLSVWQDTYVYPSCVTTLLAGSAYGSTTVDFVVGDYNFNDYGTRYVEANLYSGTGSATVEWNSTNGLLTINSVLFHVEFAGGTSPLVYVWDVHLTAGTTYAFNFNPYGSAASHLLLFRNASGGTCWKRRMEAEFDVTSTTTYVAPATGYYGVVVVNDNGASGAAEGNVEACTTPIALASGVAQSSDLVLNYYSFDQQPNYWTAIGLRRDYYSFLAAYRSAPGDVTTGCLADMLTGSSPAPSYASVVVGDFNYNATGTYYVGASRSMNLPPYAGTTQWDSGADELTVNGMLTNGTMGSSDVVRVWDVLLYAGTSYHFTFSRSGTGLNLLLFRNSAAGEYWDSRSAAVLSTTADADYTAPSSGYYGAVLVKDSDDAESYTVGVGTCSTPVTLYPGMPLVTPLAENYVKCDMDYGGWVVVGVRGSDPTTDWDMVMQSGASAQPFPDCRGPELVASDQGAPTADFIVVDFNHTTPDYYYGWPHTYFGQGAGTGTILWEVEQGDELIPNEPLRPCALGPDDFLSVWLARLTAGTTYWLRYFPSDATGSSLMLFRNPTAGSYWAPRSSAVVSSPGGEDQAYVAPVTDRYGAVVVNDGGQTGTGYVGFGTCGPPAALTAGVTTTSSLAQNYYSVAQWVPYWTAVGVRGATPWGVSSYASASGCAYPICFNYGLAACNGTSTRAGIVVGDFNHDPVGTYYVRSEVGNEFEPSAAGTVEWDGGSDQIVVGAAAVNRSTGSSDVLEVWDCWLAPQKDYTFHFSHAGAADLRLLVFRNTGGGTYWVGRDGAQIELTGTATWRTTGTSSEFYGLVVVNDNGGTGSYTLQVTDAGASAADDVPPSATEFGGVRPNPVRGGARLEFTLHEAADVSFQVLDMAGRRVATIPVQGYGAGRGTAQWDGSGPGGARLPAGVYLVRMTAGGRVVGTRRVALLE